MDVHIPAYLQANILRWGFGAEGTQWLADLPRRIEEIGRNWGLHVGPAFDKDGAVSWVAPVELHDGTEAVLKITLPHDEPRFESDALRLLDGRGAVRLLRASDDGFVLLLERCRPGTDLWSLDAEEGHAVACGLLPRLWRDPAPDAPFMALADFVAGWWQKLPRITADADYDEAKVAAAVARGNDLAASQPRRVVLHGDFHPGNILAARREPWLCIDPKPLVGEPAYDLAQWLFNRAHFLIESDDAVTVLRRHIERLAADLDLDPVRIAGWTFAKVLGFDYGPAFVTLFQQVARAW